ncbi:asparaginyl-tRNA synthetase [Sporothrix brasiliensis 5110]|uniref:Asparaginyl-tRNA synthetase n=1 Tax=Sporothrix brasiliensis 5110 TaxID=1398154 RepID=A0A0C2F4S9_9PEZI|nr:asparaginyl-tRNA synthetase [Sporothrix brasiliensis 5110]KIH93934.1 asparaginyl-tRNA synthetase [Sporothrix brasiliensis 5110]
MPSSSSSSSTTFARPRPRRPSARSRRPLLFSCSFSQQHCLQAAQSSLSSDTPTSVAGFLEWAPAEAVPGVVVHGFVRSVRTMKKYTFVTLGDGSSLAAMQAVVPAELLAASAVAKVGEAPITNGCAVRLEGAWTPSPGAGQSHELHVTAFQVAGPSDAKTFPIQKKYQTPEFLRTLPHLRPRIPLNTTLLRFRSDVVASLNRFFAERAFVQTHPPLITSSDCEGAGEVFTVTAGPSSSTTTATSPDNEESHFFRSPKYLTVSTQLHLEALAQSLGNVWTLSPTFRAEANDTPRHLSEFYMLEAEVSFVDRLDGVMDLVEDMLRHVATENRGGRAYTELVAAATSAKSKAHDNGEEAVDLETRWSGLLSAAPWPRITYAEALRILSDAPTGTFEFTPAWEMGLMTEHERYLARVVGGPEAAPVFVTHYPRASKAFYMLPTDAEGPADASADTVDCFDLLVPEFCEIAGGSMREHRLDQLVATMRARGMPVPAEQGGIRDGEVGEAGEADASSGGRNGLDWYVDLRRWGCPPHGGFGVGLDRLLCYLTGVPTVRDMVAFPRWYGRCDC